MSDRPGFDYEAALDRIETELRRAFEAGRASHAPNPRPRFRADGPCVIDDGARTQTRIWCGADEAERLAAAMNACLAGTPR